MENRDNINGTQHSAEHTVRAQSELEISIIGVFIGAATGGKKTRSAASFSFKNSMFP